MHDTLEGIAAKLPKWLRGFVLKQGYEIKIRTIPSTARVHPTVLERLALPSVVQSDKVDKYLPDGLKDNEQCAAFYPPKTVAKSDDSSVTPS